MRLCPPSPMDSLFWGWRRLAWGYVGVAVVVATFAAHLLSNGNATRADPLLLWNPAAVAAARGDAHFVSGEEAPRVDTATGIVALPGFRYSPEWNPGILGMTRRQGSVSPSFKDRTVDPAAIAAAFDRDPGIDMGDGSREISVGDRRVSIEVYDSMGCGTGLPDRLRCGDRSFPVGRRMLSVLRPNGSRIHPIDARYTRSAAWVPHMTAVRARVSDDARTLWLRGTDVESQRWIITADLVTATVIQIDADPAE